MLAVLLGQTKCGRISELRWYLTLFGGFGLVLCAMHKVWSEP